VLTSRLSSKGQLTLPKKIREIIRVDPGDVVAYEVAEGKVSLKRIEPFDAAFHAALSKVMDEWMTPEDEQAFRDL